MMWVGKGLSRVEMNAQKTGALDSPPKPKGEVCFIFSLDAADDFIDGDKYQSRGCTEESFREFSFKLSMLFQHPGIHGLDDLTAFRGYVSHHCHRTKLLAHV